MTAFRFNIKSAWFYAHRQFAIYFTRILPFLGKVISVMLVTGEQRMWPVSGRIM